MCAPFVVSLPNIWWCGAWPTAVSYTHLDEPGPLLLVRGTVQQVLHEQGLVARRGHLSHKDYIVPVHRGLVAVGQVGVDGVAHLMGQGEHAVQVVFVVEQHIDVYKRQRHVRGRKHFSARKRANCLLSADNECAAAGRNLPLGKGFAFFEGLLLHELLHLVQQGAEQI